MSAIAGIFHLNDEPINLEYGKRMMKELEMYPADDVQTWHSDKVFLGCHAQWITPESIGEKLPYYDDERRLAITADAIIDNREELFEKLQIEKSKQKSITDSELILLSYHKWGDDVPKYLIGDFAFMIWDEREQKLFGARDFSGTRTLYYNRNQQNFAFCTVIHVLLSLPSVKKELNEQWLAEYLAIGGMIDAVDAAKTPYKNIEQVPPSHSISIRNKKIIITRYCTLTQDSRRLKLKSDNEYVEAFREIFQSAVTSRLRTHRKIGSQLSGGLDSGSVVSFAANALKKDNKTLHTFSYIPPSDFKDFTPKYLLADERPYIQATVKHVGGIEDHYLDFHGRDSYSEIDSILEILEMPYKFFENSFWQKGMFEKAYEEGVGVLLNGNRGNFSISWGFALDYYSILLKKLKWIHLLKELDKYCNKVGGPRLGLIPDIVRIAFPVLNRLFPDGTEYKFPRLINAKFAEKTGVFKRFKKEGIGESGWFDKSDIFNERKRHFSDVFQWNAGNSFAAKLSLRYPLWRRDPTNDLRVIKYCLAVPEEQYVRNGMDRALIRRATKDYLPDKVRLNQQIRGVQGADWVHRMVPHWELFRKELELLRKDERIIECMDAQVINNAVISIGDQPKIEKAPDSNYKLLMRSLILYRFIKQFS